MDTAPAIMVLAPMFAPIIALYGLNSVHFGVVMTVNLAIGMVTPPVGLNLYVAASLVNAKVDTVINRHLFIYIGLAILCMLLFIVFPNIILFLPNVLKSLR